MKKFARKKAVDLNTAKVIIPEVIEEPKKRQSRKKKVKSA